MELLAGVYSNTLFLCLLLSEYVSIFVIIGVVFVVAAIVDSPAFMIGTVNHTRHRMLAFHTSQWAESATTLLQADTREIPLLGQRLKVGRRNRFPREISVGKIQRWTQAQDTAESGSRVRSDALET